MTAARKTNTLLHRKVVTVCKSSEIILLFYTTSIKPQLEYSAQVWVPQFKQDVIQLEFIQIESVQPGQTSGRSQLLRLGGEMSCL